MIVKLPVSKWVFILFICFPNGKFYLSKLFTNSSDVVKQLAILFSYLQLGLSDLEQGLGEMRSSHTARLPLTKCFIIDYACRADGRYSFVAP